MTCRAQAELASKSQGMPAGVQASAKSALRDTTDVAGFTPVTDSQVKRRVSFLFEQFRIGTAASGMSLPRAEAASRAEESSTGIRAESSRPKVQYLGPLLLVRSAR